MKSSAVKLLSAMLIAGAIFVFSFSARGETAASPDDSLSQYQAGLRCSQNGDHIQAVEHFRKAAEQGLKEAQFKLGECYFYGRETADGKRGSSRVVRGGSWRSDAAGCRPAKRNFVFPDSHNNELGFRVVLVKIR